MIERKIPNAKDFILHHVRALVLRAADDTWKGEFATELAQHKSSRITRERYLNKKFDIRKLFGD
jgi:hypothetical protein